MYIYATAWIRYQWQEVLHVPLINDILPTNVKKNNNTISPRRKQMSFVLLKIFNRFQCFFHGVKRSLLPIAK